MSKQEAKPSAPEKSRLAAAQVCDLAGLVDYAEGAIVSRTLVENEAGTVTLFAFDEGQKLSEHTAPFDALVQVLDGVGEITIGGRPQRVGSGHIVLMPAHIPHAVLATQRFKMLLTMLRKKA